LPGIGTPGTLPADSKIPMNFRRWAVFAVALLAGCSPPTPDVVKSELIAADKAFSAMSAKEGAKAAFLYYITQDAKLLSDVRVGPDAVNATFRNLPSTALLTWGPAYVDASASGDLGYTWGRYRLSFPSAAKNGKPYLQTGTYVTIWKRQAGGGWKFVLDGGNPDGTR
jgi:ketosteroid isomerase-like protein